MKAIKRWLFFCILFSLISLILGYSKYLTLNHSDFFLYVYDVVKLIPKGRVTSYGAIAAYLGSKQSSRMVGWAMNASHKLKEVPAHRVVNRNGILTGKDHFNTPDRLQQLLEGEGLVVTNNQVQHFQDYFWDPSIELKIP